MRHKLAVCCLAASLLIIAFGWIAPHLGSEFTPKLSEGSIAINIVRLAGTDLSESVRYNTQIERVLLQEFPDEIEHVWSRCGAAEIATDPMGVELTDLFIDLTPVAQWKAAQTQSELTERIQQALRELLGQHIAYTQPIELRLNEMVTGVRSDLAVKVFGDDLDVLIAKAHEIESILRSIDGNQDVVVQQITGQPVLRIKMLPDQLARYGLSADNVLDLVESMGGKTVGEIFEGQLWFPLAMRLPQHSYLDPDSIADIEISTVAGERVPLGRVAKVELATGPSTIEREWSQRRIAISCNVRGRDIGSFVAQAQRAVDQVRLPNSRYRVEWGGQFEHLNRRGCG